MSHKVAHSHASRRRKQGSKKRRKAWQVAHHKRVLQTRTSRGRSKRFA